MLSFGLFNIGASSENSFRSDKAKMIEMFDQAGIDFSDPSEDHTPNAISVKVDGQNVTGIDGHTAIFIFDKRNKMSRIVLWSTNMANQKE
jgi:hypothetical protein